ncbi:MAG TPA: DUF5989 family protein [Chthoniobacteraceae bacterium]|jgi:hypothetical protein|nr:DUF5989 family protein [Chthoniobacteraceae bacterium]
MKTDENESFEEAGRHARPNLFAEVWGMLRQNKKYWLLPIIIVLVLIGALVILGSTAAAPFIYTLF